jgi:hypothetical protein
MSNDYRIHGVVAATAAWRAILGEHMSLSWNIDTAGTLAVLKTSAANIDAQNAAAREIGAAVSGVGAVVGTGIVAKALNDYVEQSLAPGLTSVAARSARIVQGTNDALIAYVQGDSQMASDAQASALASESLAPDAIAPDTGRSTQQGIRQAELG